MSMEQPYQAAGFYLLRAPLLPAHTFFQVISASSPEVLLQLAEHPVIRHALYVASPSLFERLELIRSGQTTKPQKMQRAFSRLLRYLIRLSTRPTPFGLFAGIAFDTFADQSNVRLAASHRHKTHTRSDMYWLYALLSFIETLPVSQEVIPYQANQTLYFAGSRLVVPYPDIYEQSQRASLSVRATPVVKHLHQLARTPRLLSELVQKMQEAFPQASQQQIEMLLQSVVHNHILISTLQLPLSQMYPASIVLERLQALPSSRLRDIANALEKILQAMADIDREGPGCSLDKLYSLSDKQHRLLPRQISPTMQVDMRLQLHTKQLHQDIAQAAAKTAELLTRLSLYQDGYPHLREYHRKFAERYGHYTEVPLLELLSPEKGLDAPATYMEPPGILGSAGASTPESTIRRDALLCELAATALRERKREVRLTEALVEQLQLSATPSYPPSQEVYLQVHASSYEALDYGQWRAVLAPNTGSLSGGRTFGRFMHLYEHDDLARLQQYIQRQEDEHPDILFAELSYRPLYPRSANVVVHPTLFSYEITVNTMPSVPPERVIQLDDLVVGIRQGRFYLRSLRLKKEVIVCHTSMLNIRKAPNVCRFLIEVSEDRSALPVPFDWGAAEHLPFLPRLVYEDKIVLRPARWLLRRESIPTDPAASFFEALQAWRAAWDVPRYTYLVNGDQRLLLDLENALTVAELRTELQKTDPTQSIQLEEMYPDFEHLWLQDEEKHTYVSEIVVPVSLRSHAGTSTQQRVTQEGIPSPPAIISARERNILPGNDWVYLHLYLPLSQQNEFIADTLFAFVHSLRQSAFIDRWFYVRYRDPEQHLRLRLHACNADVQGRLLQYALEWSGSLAEKEILEQVTLNTYSREIERYGGPLAIEQIERFFTLDSDLCRHLLRSASLKHIRLDPLLLAVSSLDFLFDTWGFTFDDRLQWLRTTVPEAFQEEFRTHQKELSELLVPWRLIHPMREPIQQAVLTYQAEIHQVAHSIRTLESRQQLWGNQKDIAGSLVHMHINRLLGIDSTDEQKVLAFWRLALESIAARPS